MGQGYSYTCKKCKHEYRVYLGIGMGYLGSSTRSEIEYAKAAGKVVRYLESE